MLAHDKVLVGFCRNHIAKNNGERVQKNGLIILIKGFIVQKRRHIAAFFQIIKYEYGAVERFRKGGV